VTLLSLFVFEELHLPEAPHGLGADKVGSAEISPGLFGKDKISVLSFYYHGS
jgi:hypothetical protein